MVRVRVLPHIKKLDECFCHFLRARHMPAWDVPPHRAGSTRADRGTLGNTRCPGTADAMLELREEGRGGRGSREAQAARRGGGQEAENENAAPIGGAALSLVIC